MKYALRITRDAGGDAVSVHPVIRVRDTVKPFRRIHRSGGTDRYTESLRLFDTRAEAEEAFREEQTAAEFSVKTSEELDSILRQDIAELKREGFSFSLACRLLETSENSIRGFLSYRNPPNPRVVAKIHLLLPLIREFRERTRSLLPLEEGASRSCRPRPYPWAKKYTLD